MRKNSRNKGSRFERYIAKVFQTWTGYNFSRTPGSGGWAKAKDSLGDLVCTDERHGRRFPFSIECKSYSDIRFEHILLGNKTCKILGFWQQAQRDAEKVDKIPLLIMKYNNMPKDEAFVALDDIGIKAIFPDLNSKKPWMYIWTPEKRLYILMLSEVISLPYIDVYKNARCITNILKSQR